VDNDSIFVHLDGQEVLPGEEDRSYILFSKDPHYKLEEVEGGVHRWVRKSPPSKDVVIPDFFKGGLKYYKREGHAPSSAIADFVVNVAKNPDMLRQGKKALEDADPALEKQAIYNNAALAIMWGLEAL